jgi:hypothetical protein
VEVEVVVPAAAAAPRIADAEELAPLQLFQQYADSKGLSPEVRYFKVRLSPAVPAVLVALRQRRACSETAHSLKPTLLTESASGALPKRSALRDGHCSSPMGV